MKKSTIFMAAFSFVIGVAVSFQTGVAADMSANPLGSDASSPAEKTKETSGMKWISSTDLLKNQTFVDLSKTDQERLKRVWGAITVGPETGWKIHKGDLAIDGSLDNEDPLIVDGNLTIKGSYDDYMSGMGHLIVLGDFNVTNVLSNDDMYVQGKLMANGLIFTYYNDFSFRVDGGVNGKGIIVDDKSNDWFPGDLGFVIDTFGHSAKHLDLALRSTIPEIWINPDYIEEGLDMLGYACEEDMSEMSGTPSLSMIASHIHAGLPIFRKNPAPAELAGKICEALDPEVPESALPALMAYDPLVRHTLAARTDLGGKANQIIKTSEDPVTLAILMTHREIDKSMNVSRLSINEARVLAGREDIADEIVTQLVRLEDKPLLETLSGREDLPVAVVEALVNKGIDALTARLLQWYDNGFRLPPKTKKTVLQSKNKEVRSALIFCDLDEKEALDLVRESSAEDRKALAERLTEQAQLKAPTGLRIEEIHNIAEHLVKNDIPEAIPALSDQRQLEVVRQLKTLSLNHAEYFAKATTSRPLMEFLFEKFRDLEVMEALSRNVALPDDLQVKILNRGLAEIDDNSDWDDVFESLLGNENVSDNVLKLAGKHLVESDFSPSGLLSHLQSCDRLPPDVLISLDKAMKTEFFEDWYLSILFQENADKALVEKALRVYYADEEELQDYLKKITSLTPDEWWRKLATSPFDDLWEVASTNKATDPEMLLKLAEDNTKHTFALSNPALPEKYLTEILSKAVAEGRKDSFSVVSNPNYPIGELRVIADSGASYALRSIARKALVIRMAGTNQKK